MPIVTLVPIFKRRPFAVMAALACFVLSARAQNIDFQTIQIQTVKITDGLYVLMGGPAQGNIAVSVGADGLLLVDSMYAPMHQKIMDALAKIRPSNQPIRYLVNTHLHGDHTGGNEAMAKLGAVIISHENMRGDGLQAKGGPMRLRRPRCRR